MKKKFPWGGLLFGVAVVGVTGGVLYMASRSSSALDEARRIYRRLSPRERFIGMLYLDGALSDSPAPKNKGPEAGSSLAILAMNLLSEVSPADRAAPAPTPQPSSKPPTPHSPPAWAYSPLRTTKRRCYVD